MATSGPRSRQIRDVILKEPLGIWQWRDRMSQGEAW
jgi:hypothetical protein